MRRLEAVSAVLVLLLSYFTFSIPTVSAADDVCWVFQMGLINNDTVAHTGIVRFHNPTTLHVYGEARLTLNPGEQGTLRLAAFVPAGITPILGGYVEPGLSFDPSYSFGPADASACGSGGGGSVARIADGRVNDTDLGASLAAYCKSGGMEVWDIDASGHGTLSFSVTKAEIKMALDSAKTSGQNVLIAEGLGDSLYALSSNELVLIGPDVKEPGKLYQRILAPDVCGK